MISGILPLRNGVKLGYPFDLAIRSLLPLCDEVVVSVDPTSEDDTLARVRAIPGVKVVESVWDMSNHDGHRNCEISVQTRRLLKEVRGPWVFSLQADEILHEGEVDVIREAVLAAEARGVTGLEMRRLYFYGSLSRLREDWTLWMVRLFKRDLWMPDVDGAMRFDPVGGQLAQRVHAARIWHYSRLGDPRQIAERVRNLDRLFHAPEKVQAGPLPPYDFGRTRKLDTYVIGHEAEEAEAVLSSFDPLLHPWTAREAFRE